MQLESYSGKPLRPSVMFPGLLLRASPNVIVFIYSLSYVILYMYIHL